MCLALVIGNQFMGRNCFQNLFTIFCSVGKTKVTVKGPNVKFMRVILFSRYLIAWLLKNALPKK